MPDLYTAGPQSTVNTITSGVQTQPRTAALGYRHIAGTQRVVVVWEDRSASADDSTAAVRLQILGADGMPQGSELRVNTTTAGDQTDPSVGASGEGFIVAWTDSSGAAEGRGTDIRARYFGSDLQPVGDDFLVNTGSTSGDQQQARAAMLTGGGRIIAWMDLSGGGSAIRARHFQSDGLGPEFTISSSATAVHSGLEIAPVADNNSRTVAIWTQANGDGSGSAVMARVMMYGGTAIGPAFAVSESSAGDQRAGAVASYEPSDGFVVVWIDDGAGAPGAVKLRLFDAEGDPVSGDILVAAPGEGAGDPSVTAFDSGLIAVSWHAADGSLQVQLVNGSGELLGAPFEAADGEPLTELASLIAIGSETLLASWTSGTDVQVRKFVPAGPAVIDIELGYSDLAENPHDALPAAELRQTGIGGSSGVVYTIVADSTGGGFAIEGGSIVVADPALIDFETASQVQLTVRATNSAGHSREEIFTLDIADSAVERAPWLAGPLFEPTAAPYGTAMPQLAPLASGGFVLAYFDSNFSPDNPGVRLRIYDADGEAIGGSIEVPIHKDGNYHQLQIAALRNGGFVVMFGDTREGLGNTGEQLRLQVFDSAGTAVSEQVKVAADSISGGQRGEIAALEGGGFVAVWQRIWNGSPENANQLRAQLFDSAGNKIGGEFAVAPGRPPSQFFMYGDSDPSVAGLEDGGFVITWTDDYAQRILGQRFSAAGAPIGDLFAVTPGPGRYDSSVAPLDGGGFVVSYINTGGVERSGEIEARIYDSSGAAIGLVSVGTPTVPDQRHPVVTPLADGGFMIAWNEQFGPYSFIGVIKAQRFDSAGTKIGGEFVVQPDFAPEHNAVTAATLGWGAVVLAYSDWGGDTPGASQWVHARMVSPVGFEAEADSLVADEATTLTGSVFADNGSGADGAPDGGALMVTEVNGSAADVGRTIALGSGALLTLNADGSFSYDPNGAFDDLADFSTGASNRRAFESFTYRIGGGAEATATVDVRGLWSAPHIVEGTDGADVLTGTPYADIFAAGAGADSLTGGLGDDVYEYDGTDSMVEAAGGGTDEVRTAVASYALPEHFENLTGTGTGQSLTGNAAANRITAGGGVNTLAGGPGDDVYVVADQAQLVSELASQGTDTVETDASSYSLEALPEIENLTGTGALNAQTLTGNSRSNVIDGGSGDDTMRGLGGDDSYVVDSAADVVEEQPGGGVDTIRTALAAYSLESLPEIENLIGLSAAGQTLTGNGSANVVTGGGGADELRGEGGNDRLDGGAGADSMRGGTGDDTYVVDHSGDSIVENADEGTDEVRTGLAAFSIASFDHVENLTGTSNLGQALTGNAGVNRITGAGGNDTIDGGGGDDTMTGGGGDDVYLVDSFFDRPIEADGGGTDEVRTTVSFYLTWSPNVENLTAIDTGINLSLTGNAGANEIRGSAQGDFIDGGGGDDRMIGGGGWDHYTVDSAGDQVVELAGGGDWDRVDTSLAAYTLPDFVEQVFGNSSTQTLTGNGLDNFFLGRGGGDTMIGLGGNDVYVVAPGDTVVEEAGGGTDAIVTNIAVYALPDHVEELRTDNFEQDYVFTGNALDNKISGHARNDVIDGGAGADRMDGWVGDDIYYVDNAGDVVVDITGTDEVRTTLVSYSLGADIENLTGLLSTGQSLTGNGVANRITGGAGNDSIDGGGGADSMEGFDGDDVYVVDSSGDSVVEEAGKGTDEIRTRLAVYSLASQPNIENLVGLAGSGQHLTGNGGANAITGGTGADTLLGEGGDDRLDGGAGGDSMSGGAGDDLYFADHNGDSIVENENEGTDEVRTGLAAFSIASFAHVETLTGTSAAGQTLTGNGGANAIFGGSGNDTIDGGGGGDSMTGGAGDDIYFVESSFDRVFESAGGGTDEIRSSLPNFSLADLPEVENLTGLSGAEVQGLTGNSRANRITGGSGMDAIDGGAGDDVMIGGLGDDLYLVDSLGDSVVELAGQGRDEVRTALAAYTLAANADVLMGTSNAGQSLTGNALDNAIEGGFGNDVLDGAGGSDTLYGRGGDDVYVLGAGDVAVEFADQGTDEIRTALAAFSLAGIANVENLAGTAATGQALTGSAGSNRIAGGAGNDVIDGGAGNDVMAGGAGNDVYVVDSAGDSVVEISGEGTQDQVRTALAAYTLGANVEYLTGTSATGQRLTGNGVTNVIAGGTGNDVLNGAGGADRLIGGAGHDLYYVDNEGDLAIEESNAGSDTVSTLVNYTLGANIETLTANDIYGSAALRLTGNALANNIYGTFGDNVLNGAGGADFMAGYGGNDLYYVDHESDFAYEDANGGIDRVATAVSYVLGANIENLQANDIGGTAPLSLTGNALANNIYGTQGNNVLNGAGGADFMAGYSGHDLYYVDHVGDFTYEEANGGTDRVVTAVSYVLGANVENLQANDIGGTAALTLTGNSLSNNIYGTQGNNVLNGAGGADFMAGYGGHDLYYVDHAGDVAYEDANGGIDRVVTAVSYALGGNVENLQSNDIGGTAALTLVGNDIANVIWGTNGDNAIYGRGGNDELYGYAGSDRFVFDTAPGMGNYDMLGDFQAGVDRIVLDNAIYTALADGALAPSAFVNGSAAADADDRIVYYQATGGLFYDADGSGSGAMVLFAIVAGGQPLTAADFLVI